MGDCCAYFPTAAGDAAARGPGVEASSKSFFESSFALSLSLSDIMMMVIVVVFLSRSFFSEGVSVGQIDRILEQL